MSLSLWERSPNARRLMISAKARQGAHSTLVRHGADPTPAVREVDLATPAGVAVLEDWGNSQSIIASILHKHGFHSLREVAGPSKHPELVAVVQELAYYLRRYGRRVTGERLTDEQIARHLSRERSTVIYAAAAYAKRNGLPVLKRHGVEA